MRTFKGIYGIVLTPFKSDGKPNLEALEKYASRAAENPSMTGLVVCGSTGEFTRLSFEENVDIMKTVSRANAGRKHFICGATAGDSYTASKYCECIAELGADGVLLAPPYYFKLTDDEIYAYYADVINSMSNALPFIGYNIPQCTNGVSVNVFEKLLQFECLKGYKNSWNDMQEITTEIALRDAKRNDVSMFTGLDACLYCSLALGVVGIFSAITYLMPQIVDVIYKDFGKSERAFKCQCDLIKLINVVNRFTFPYGYRLLSLAVGEDLGEGREAVPPQLAKESERAVEDMRMIYKQLCKDYAEIN